MASKTKKQTAAKLRAAEIQAANEAFEKLSPAKKRVAIARDVLAQIGTRIRAAQGTYLRSSKLAEAMNTGKVNVQLQKIFKQEKSCTVCAKGALFLCNIDRSNKLKISELESESRELQGKDVTTYLERLFDERQLDLIESAFECRDMSEDNEDDEFGEIAEDVQDAIDFGRLFANDPDDYDDDSADAEALLRAIMENIVVNKGTFRPEIHPVQKWVTAGFRG